MPVGRSANDIQHARTTQCRALDSRSDDAVNICLVLVRNNRISLNRSTIVQHLLNDTNDPFNRQPLTEAMVQPQPELRKRIEEFVARRVDPAARPPTDDSLGTPSTNP